MAAAALDGDGFVLWRLREHRLEHLLGVRNGQGASNQLGALNSNSPGLQQLAAARPCCLYFVPSLSSGNATASQSTDYIAITSSQPSSPSHTTRRSRNVAPFPGARAQARSPSAGHRGHGAGPGGRAGFAKYLPGLVTISTIFSGVAGTLQRPRRPVQREKKKPLRLCPLRLPRREFPLRYSCIHYVSIAASPIPTVRIFPFTFFVFGTVIGFVEPGSNLTRDCVSRDCE